MEILNTGENLDNDARKGDSLADVSARIKQYEQQKQAQPVVANQENAPKVVQTPVVPEKPADQVVEKKEVPVQFMNKDGKLDENKIQKSNENLEKAILSRQEQLLKLNKELNKKFTQTSQEVSDVKKQVEPVVEQAPLDTKKKFLEDLEKDTHDTLVKLIDERIKPVRSEISNVKAKEVEMIQARELDELVSSGNDWILSEGLGRFEAVFNAKPFLRQSETPYKDALRFIDVPSKSGQTPSDAQIGATTPIIGDRRAVPPPSSNQTVSIGQSMENLSQELRAALKCGDRKLAQEIGKKMERFMIK